MECTVWVRDQAGTIPDRVVTHKAFSHVARIAVGGDILLTVHPNCTMAWVPYTAGDVIPRKAIVTGMLANGRRLYSILSWHAAVGKWIAGVYAEQDAAAYYPYTDSNAVTQFDILVFV